jgi:hypothetical protein
MYQKVEHLRGQAATQKRGYNIKQQLVEVPL